MKTMAGSTRRKLYVLQAPKNVAGQLALTADGLRRIGLKVGTCYFVRHGRGYSQPVADYEPFACQSMVGWARMLFTMAWFIARYNVFHFHYGRSLLPERYWFKDAQLLKRLGRRVIVEFWGSDVRLPSVEMQRNPYYVNSYGENEQVNRKRMQAWSNITMGHVIVASGVMASYVVEYFPHIHRVPQRMNVQDIVPEYPNAENCAPMLVHAPSQLAFKGTDIVRAAVGTLRGEGFTFRYVELSNVHHTVLLDAVKKADLVIDQLRGGDHGAFAVEAMAFGKPVICYILPEFLGKYPDGFPVINANPDNLTSVLRSWLTNGRARHERGRLSRAYAERVHDHIKIASKLVDIYRSLP